MSNSWTQEAPTISWTQSIPTIIRNLVAVETCKPILMFSTGLILWTFLSEKISPISHMFHYPESTPLFSHSIMIYALKDSWVNQTLSPKMFMHQLSKKISTWVPTLFKRGLLNNMELASFLFLWAHKISQFKVDIFTHHTAHMLSWDPIKLIRLR
jgi:hypothetical protein